jgi:hypothetical protein
MLKRKMLEIMFRDDVHDNEADVFPVTDGAHSLGSLTDAQRRAAVQRVAAVVQAHCQEFVRRAFPPREIPVGIPRLTTVAIATMVWPQMKLDYIDKGCPVLGTGSEDQKDGA